MSEAGSTGGGVGRSSLLLLAGRMGGNLGYFVGALVLARALGPAGRGAVAFLTTTALVVAMVSAAGLREATTVFLAQRPELRPQLFANTYVFALLFSVVATGIVCAGLVLLPSLRPARVDATDVAALGVGGVGAALLQSGFTLSLGLSLFRQWAVIQPFYVWTYAAALGVAWATGTLTIASATFIWAIAQLFGAALLTANALRRSRPGRPSFALFREHWTYGLRAWVGSLSTFLGFRLDQVIMGVISTDAALGIYAVAVNASEVELYVPQSVGNGLLPAIAATEPALRAERTVRVFRMVTVATVAIAAVAFAIGPWLLPLVFGDGFRPSVGPFLWLVGGGIGFVGSSIFSAALVASNAPGRSSLGPLVSLALGTALDFALIPGHGATGAAVAAAAAFVGGGATAAIAFVRLHRLRWSSLVPRVSDLTQAVEMVRRRDS